MSEICYMFDERIKELRMSLGMSQVQFARKLFISKQCVCNWENNNLQPSVDLLTRIAMTFSVSTDYLLGVSREMTLDVTGLSTEQILHIQNVVNDLKSAISAESQKNEEQD